MIGERPVEIAAFFLGLANIILLVRRSIWNYPFGIVMVSLYGWIFYGEKLYSDVLLQIFFFVVQIYGWAHWMGRRDEAGRVIVTALGGRAALAYALAALAGVAALGGFMATYTDASFPFWDASVAVLSVIAQILLARRRLENWLVWVGVDALAIGLYWTKGLYPTAALYTLFLVIAAIGYVNWRRAFARGEAIEE
ncbi:nicotinamide mononucleotide transporter [Marinicaulis flavus]|uniref:Nicotinamide riboside transporter PnuC n=2 Tax=Hyphococcus luteus TaxID=2058213 RepID=A0A2S7K8F8_9PROT|nr:nicotinamide mononucleotide transporter [Marinicaulis flavus]